jgi:outer membrane protein W
MKRTLIVCIVIAGLALASSLTAADGDWIIRGNYVKTWPSTDSYQTQSVLGTLPDIFTELSLDSGQGFGLDIEYMATEKWGVVLLAIFTDMEGTFVAGIEPGEASDRVIDNNTVDVYTVNFGANYHFAPDSRVDFYLGAYLGWFSYDSIRFNLPEIDQQVKINFDDQFSYGLNAGLDIPFTRDSPWLFTVALKYLVSDLKETGGPREIAIDPLIGSIGIGYKF